MSKNEKTAVTEENEKLSDNLSEEEKVKQSIGERVDLVVGGAKDVVDKSAEFIGDAAKVVGDFAGVQLKQAKGIFDKINKDFSETKSQKNLEKYKPIFPDVLAKGEISFPEMINVVDFDKRMGIAECQGAVGYQETIKNVDLIGVYKDDIDKYGIEFYPEKTVSAYYVHPLEKNKYIEISEYFKYLKEARVAELKSIAQALGAKHFKVSIMEESSTEQIKKDKAEVQFGLAKDKAGVDVGIDNSEKKYDFVGVAVESFFKGKEPVRPELKFWANSEAIKSLVEQRLAKDSPLISETYRLDYNTSTGIKEKEAAKIDGVLKVLKFKGAGSISEEVKKESKKKFEYTIEF